jgi:hypothetical protein
MIGIVTLTGILSIIITGIMFLIELPLIKIVMTFMQLEENNWKNCIKIAASVVLFNLFISIILAVIKLESNLSAIIGAILFSAFIYFIISKVSPSSTKKEKIAFTIILLFFSIILNALLVVLGMFLVQTIKIA